ncbi:hypothetical protein [Thalassotalea crassostreae]|uniref:hypothetical protein n=1 Tax=Thalassotalea crassostreae TaxID=1763536 RepID=UPI0012FE1BF7|nr:hypothetical protein [Thalassotalea crassostreae]
MKILDLLGKIIGRSKLTKPKTAKNSVVKVEIDYIQSDYEPDRFFGVQSSIQNKQTTTAKNND